MWVSFLEKEKILRYKKETGILMRERRWWWTFQTLTYIFPMGVKRWQLQIFRSKSFSINSLLIIDFLYLHLTLMFSFCSAEFNCFVKRMTKFFNLGIYLFSYFSKNSNKSLKTALMTILISRLSYIVIKHFYPFLIEIL